MGRKICIIGAGPSGITAAKNCLQAGLDFVVFDKQYNPLVGIELNGSSHFLNHRQSRDRLTENLLHNIGVEYHEIDLSKKYNASETKTLIEKKIELVVFKMGSFFNVFVKGSDGSFEWFCPHFFLMFHLFKVGGITEQLTNYFENFLTIELNDFILALCDCGFRTIFYASAIAPIQEIKYFIDSDFGVLLRQIIRDLNEFPERLYDHYSLKDKNDGGCFSSLSGRTVDVKDPKNESRIRENCHLHIEFLQKNKYIQQLRLIFETILAKLKGRPNLEPEVQEFISSLEQVLKFLTPKN